MRVGVNLGYWSRDDGPAGVDLAVRADRLGYQACFAAEAYGSDAATVLAFVAARTERLDLCAAVLQMPARSPAMTAMTAATLDTLSGGRFRLGLGVSGPQVAEGWHGVRFDAPLGRTRDYVAIVRTALSGKRVDHQGEHLQVPLPGGSGKSLKLGFRPPRSSIPISLAAIGPANLRLTGRIADGWLGLFFSPDRPGLSLDAIREGRLEAGADPHEPLAGFDVATLVPVAVHDDLDVAADTLRAHYALYIGGMGSRDRNFYHRLATRLGYGPAADRVQELYLDGQAREAAAAVPAELIDETALIGPPGRLAARLGRYADAGVTTVGLGPTATPGADRAQTLEAVADAVDPATGRPG